MTQVHQLFARSAYGPAQLKVLGRAFASTSQRLADKGALFTDLEAARTVLAKIIIHLPCHAQWPKTRPERQLTHFEPS
jgi:hypothetical protein